MRLDAANAMHAKAGEERFLRRPEPLERAIVLHVALVVGEMMLDLELVLADDRIGAIPNHADRGQPVARLLANVAHNAQVLRQHLRLGDVDVAARDLANRRPHPIVAKQPIGRGLNRLGRLFVTGELERLGPVAVGHEQRDDRPLPTRMQRAHRRPKLGHRFVVTLCNLRHLVLVKTAFAGLDLLCYAARSSAGGFNETDCCSSSDLIASRTTSADDSPLSRANASSSRRWSCASFSSNLVLDLIPADYRPAAGSTTHSKKWRSHSPCDQSSSRSLILVTVIRFRRAGSISKLLDRCCDGFRFIGRDDRPDVLCAVTDQIDGPACHAHRHRLPVRLVCGSCSFQFGRTSKR